MKNIVIDSQMLTTLMACPQLFDYTFNRDLVSVTGKSPALGTGSLVHVIAEWFAKARIEGKSYNDAVLIGYEAGKEYVKPFSPINKFIKDESHTGIENVPLESDNGKIVSVKDVFSTMEQYFDYWKNDSNTILEAEVTKKRLIYEDSEIRIMWAAKLDRVIDTPLAIMPMDIKTMKQKRDTISMNNQFMGQCHVIGSRMVMIDKIGFQKTLKPNEKFLRVPITYSLSRLEEWRTEIVPYYVNMLFAYTEAGNFPMNFTHCENKYGLCRFKEVDETDKSVREEVLRVYFKVGKKWDILNGDD